MFGNIPTIMRNQQTNLMGQRLVGEVVAHHPEIVGLIRIRLRGIHDGWPIDCLPWQQCKEGAGHGNKQTGQTAPIPPVGAKTYSKFLSNNQYHPVFSNGPSSDDKKVPGVSDNNNVYGIADHGGHKEMINTEEGKESYKREHLKGTSMEMDKDGNLNHASPEMLKQIAKQVMMQVTGMMQMEGKEGHLKFGEKLIIEAKNIEFRHQGATTTMPINLGAAGPTAPTAPTLPKAGTRPQFGAVGESV